MEFYFYNANIVRVIDGDTIVCNIDLGFDTWIHNEHVRLLGINAPEVRTRDPIEKVAGIEAKKYVERFFAQYENKIVLETFYDSTGKYGRTLAIVYVVDPENDRLISLNDKLVEEGYAMLYN